MEVYRKVLYSILASIFVVGGFWLITRTEKAPEGKSLFRISSTRSITPEQIELFNRKNKKFHLTMVPGCNNPMEILMQTAAGAGPDIIGDIDETNILTYDSVGILKDLTAVAKKNGFGLDTLPDTVRNAVTVRELTSDGKLVYKQVAYPTSVQHLFIIYNKNIFARHKIPCPSEDLTWEEYAQKARKLTIPGKRPNAMPKQFGAIGINPYTLIWEMGGTTFNRAGTRCTLDSPHAIKAMQYYHQLIHKQKVEPVQAQTGMDSQQFRLEQFANGQVAMLWASRKALEYLRRSILHNQRARQQWQKHHPDKAFPGAPPLKLGACLIPRFKNGTRYVHFTATCVAINPQSSNKQQCLDFLNFLASADYSKTFKNFPVGKPGNKKYCTAKQLSDPKFPDENEINRISVKSVRYGRIRNRCPFIPATFIEEQFQKTRFLIATSPDLSPRQIAEIMKKTTNKINRKIESAVSREKHLKKLFQCLNRENLQL